MTEVNITQNPAHYREGELYTFSCLLEFARERELIQEQIRQRPSQHLLSFSEHWVFLERRVLLPSCVFNFLVVINLFDLLACQEHIPGQQSWTSIVSLHKIQHYVLYCTTEVGRYVLFFRGKQVCFAGQPKKKPTRKEQFIRTICRSIMTATVPLRLKGS